MTPSQAELERARQELRAASVLADTQFPNQSVTRSYYAAFHAATAALLELGETRSKHSTLIAAFGRLVINDRGLDPGVGLAIKALFAARNDADYDLTPVPVEEAAAWLDRATAFVEAVAEWVLLVDYGDEG